MKRIITLTGGKSFLHLEETKILILLALSSLLLSKPSSAQLSTHERPISFSQTFTLSDSFEGKTIADLPTMDEILKEDVEDSIKGLPPRFGYSMEVRWDTENSGTWQTLSNGSRIWRLSIHSPGAVSINLLYDQFWMPDSTKFFIYNADQTEYFGAYTSINNKGDRANPGKFATELIHGDRVTLEYYQPAYVKEKPIISISYVVHGYRRFHVSKDGDINLLDFGDSLPCNINVNCWEGQPYQTQKRGVAMVVVGEGNRHCTGTLVNNTSGDLAPYFLTADHCLAGLDAITNPDAGYWSFWWNYEAPDCANPPFEPGHYSTNGAVVIANYFNTDMALLRLSEDPLDLLCLYSPAYVGWNRSSTPPTSSAGISHPEGDIKKVWLSNTPARSSNWPGRFIPDTHWEVNVVNGTVEGGSSGSLMINQGGLLVGQLHGGYLSCPPTTIYFGRFDVSWTGGGTPQRRLQDWLDPGNTNQQAIQTVERNISGPEIVCTSDTYVLRGAPTTGAVEWSLSLPGVFIMTPSGNSVTLNRIGSGSSTLRAMVGSCVLAERVIDTRATTSITTNQYGECRPDGWQDWNIIASSNFGGSNWQWTVDNSSPGAQVNIYNPAGPNTWVAIRGGSAALNITYLDDCGNTITDGTTIFAPCPTSRVFNVSYEASNKRININAFDLDNATLNAAGQVPLAIKRVIIYAPNENTPRSIRSFDGDSTKVNLEDIELEPGRYFFEIQSSTMTDIQALEVK